MSNRLEGSWGFFFFLGGGEQYSQPFIVFYAVDSLFYDDCHLLNLRSLLSESSVQSLLSFHIQYILVLCRRYRKYPVNCTLEYWRHLHTGCQMHSSLKDRYQNKFGHLLRRKRSMDRAVVTKAIHFGLSNFNVHLDDRNWQNITCISVLLHTMIINGDSGLETPEISCWLYINLFKLSGNQIAESRITVCLKIYCIRFLLAEGHVVNKLVTCLGVLILF